MIDMLAQFLSTHPHELFVLVCVRVCVCSSACTRVATCVRECHEFGAVASKEQVSPMTSVATCAHRQITRCIHHRSCAFLPSLLSTALHFFPSQHTGWQQVVSCKWLTVLIAQLLAVKRDRLYSVITALRCAMVSTLLEQGACCCEHAPTPTHTLSSTLLLGQNEDVHVDLTRLQ